MPTESTLKRLATPGFILVVKRSSSSKREIQKSFCIFNLLIRKEKFTKVALHYHQTDRESEAIFIEAVGWQNLLQFQVKELLESTLAALSAR